MPKKAELSENDMRKAVKYSIRDGGAVSFRDNIFSNFTTPFALFLGAGTELIGLLTAIPQLAGALFAPFAGKLIECAKDRKRTTMRALLLSHLAWVPVALTPVLIPQGGLLILMAVLIFSQLVRSMGSTGWTSWMADIIPKETFGKFFGRRNRAAGVAAFFSLILGGFVLNQLGPANGFTALFLTAIMFGLISYSLLSKIPDTGHESRRSRFSLKFDIKGMFRGNPNLKNFTIMAVLFNFAVYLASPFFAVYMLREMGIGYEWYAAIIALEMLIYFIAVPYWGKLADRYDDRPVMFVCGLLITFYPAFWLFINAPWQILPVAILSGFAWAGFDLSSFNYMIDVTHPEHRSLHISNFKSISAAGVIAGPIAGGLLANAFSNTTFLWLTGLQILFLIAFLLRGSSILLFVHRLKEARVDKHYHVRKLFWKAVAIYPIRGIVHDFTAALHMMETLEKKAVARERRMLTGK